MQQESIPNLLKIYHLGKIAIHLEIQLVMLKYSMIISQKSITNFNIEIQMLIPKIQPDNPKEEGK